MTALAPAPRTITDRSHVATRLGPAAFVSDIGRRRRRNEDAAAVTVRARWTGLVVADGVGGAPDGDRASAAAAGAGIDALGTARDGGGSVTDQLLAGLAAAGAATADLGIVATAAPASTFTAAVAEPGRVAAVSVGDSRAYWLPDGGRAERLSVDDSYRVDRATVDAEPDLLDRYANVITRWLGADAPPLEPRVVEVATDGPGWLLVASDGFWRHLPTGLDRSALVVPPAPADALAVAETLVRWANSLGAPDNVTVALARVAGA